MEPTGTPSGSDSSHLAPLDSAGSLQSLFSSTDPFNLASSLHSTSGGLLTALTSNGPITTGAGKRKPGQRAQPGLPPAHFLVQSGTYTQFYGKSLAGVSGLRGDEVEGDLGEMRRKRVRGNFNNGTTGRRRGNAD